MVFPILGNHSFRALVGDPNFPNLIDYGQIVHKKKLDLQLEADCMALCTKKIKPLHLMSRREKVREECVMAKKTKVKDHVAFQNKRRRRIFHIFRASNVRRTVTMPDSVVV